MKVVHICDECNEEYQDHKEAMECHGNVITREVCENCNTYWYPDSDRFGCWVCGHEYNGGGE